jgi:aminopeptidase-like protein
VALLTFLAKSLRTLPLRYSYRLLFIPGTIGSITWLCLNEAQTSRIKHGLVLACVGDPGRSTYKKSRRGDAEIDKAVAHVLKHSGQEYEIMDFFPYGYDERQFCSPGFNLPVGCLMRTPHSRYPEYHTSADDLDFVRSEYLADSFAKYLRVVDILENNKVYVSQNPKCEPQLGRRGLYASIGGQTANRIPELAMLWALNFSDGCHSLLDIADKADLEFGIIRDAADALSKYNLLKERPE